MEDAWSNFLSIKNNYNMIWVFLYVEYDKKDMHLQLNMKRFCTNIKTIGHYSAILFRSDPFMFLTSFRLVQDWGILCPTVNESSVPIVSVVNIRTNHKNCPMINDSNPSLCINWWSNNKFGASGRLGISYSSFGFLNCYGKKLIFIPIILPNFV